MDNYSLPIVAIIGGTQNQLTKEDADIAFELGKVTTRLGIRPMTKWKNKIYDALTLGANTLGKAPFVASLDNMEPPPFQEDFKLSLDRTYALYLISASIIILPGGFDTIADASYLLLQDIDSQQKRPLFFWGEIWETIINKISDQKYLYEDQKGRTFFIKNLDDIEKSLSQFI